MPHHDYNDPELVFPRLEARIQQIENEPDAYWLQVWLWEKSGVKREVFNRKRAGTWRDAHEIIKALSREHDAKSGKTIFMLGNYPNRTSSGFLCSRLRFCA
jgi:hypothetical protein